MGQLSADAFLDAEDERQSADDFLDAPDTKRPALLSADAFLDEPDETQKQAIDATRAVLNAATGPGSIAWANNLRDTSMRADALEAAKAGPMILNAAVGPGSIAWANDMRDRAEVASQPLIAEELPYPENLRPGVPQKFREPDSSAAGSFAGAAAAGVLNTVSGAQRIIANSEPTSAEYTASMDTAIQGAREQLDNLKKAIAGRGYSTAEDDSQVRNAEIALQRLEGEKQGGLYSKYHPNQDASKLERRADANEFAKELGTAADEAYSFYGANPDSENAVAQISRAGGAITALAPSLMVGLPAVAAQAGAEAFGATYNATEKELRANGEKDEEKIRTTSIDAASSAALHAAPALAAYMVGGKLSAEAVGAMLETASPAVKGILGTVGSTATNITVGSTLRALEGGDWKPTIENLTMDALFGVMHGSGEWKNASVQAKIRARDEAANRMRESGSPETAKAIEETEIAPPASIRATAPSILPADPVAKTRSEPLPADPAPAQSENVGIDLQGKIDRAESNATKVEHLRTMLYDDLEVAKADREYAVGGERVRLDREITRLKERIATKDAELAGHQKEIDGWQQELSNITGKPVAKPSTENSFSDKAIVEIPLTKLKLSKDVPQFKAGADEKGVTEPLAGTYDRTGVGPIQVWERKNGELEIISGRHRFDLAQRSGEETIPSQIHREKDGFTPAMAARLDAQLNIRDGQGNVSDFAAYFRNSGISKAEADASGLLGRAKGQAGFSIGKGASDDVFALFQAGRISDAQARAIADAAPGDAPAQAIGTRAALDGKSADYVSNLIKAAKMRASEAPSSTTGDLFNFDDTAIRDMEAQAKAASAAQKAIREQIAAVHGAAKRPEVARQMGVDVKDPAGIQKKVGELNAELDRWENWPMHSDLVAKTRNIEQPASADATAPKLRQGERQGDLLSKQTEDLTLVGEKGADTFKLSAEQEAAEKAKIEAREREAKEQTEMFGTGNGSGVLTPAMAQQPPIAPVRAISEIIRDLAKGFDIPIRFGRLTTKGFAGYFKSVANLIGSKNPNDISIVTHEVGHKFDNSFGLSKLPALRTELDTLGDPATPGSRSSWTKSKTLKYKHGEGVAEFIRYWVTDPAQATRMAPMTEKYFERILDANPDFGDVMRQARQDVQNWRNAPAEARLASSISVGSNPNKTRYRLPQLTRDLVDDLHILKLASKDAEKFSGEKLKPSEDPYTMARLLRGSYGMADTFIRRGTVDFKTKQVAVGKGLEQALKPVAGRINEFRNWIVAKRAQELHAQGRETGLVRADVDFVANKYGADADFQKAFAAVKEWSDSLLKYAVDSGYVTQKSADTMKAMNEDYVPFHRVFEIGAGEDPAQAGNGQGRGLNVGKVGSLKRLTGSQRDIVDPLETMVRNAYSLITASEKSAINRAIADLAGKQGMGKWVEEIATPKEAVKVQLEKVRKELEDAGADLKGVPDDTVLQFYRNAQQAPFGENIIKVTTGGESKFYRLNSDLFASYKALDASSADLWLRYASVPANLLRAGTTLTPDFALSNMMRDAFSSAVINKYGMLPFEGAVRGLAAMLKNPKLVAEWAASGGENSMEANYFDRQKLATFMREKITNDQSKGEQVAGVLKSPLAALRWLTGTLESATRIGEYQKSYEAARKSGMGEGDARRQAAFESRDRQDFAKGGARTTLIRQATAFWNAQLQANVKFIDAMRERPGRTMLQGLAFVTVPKLIEQAMNWNDKDYWDRPQWERDLFFLIPTGKDANGRTKFLKIPTPFEVGLIFGTIPGRMMQWAKTNKPGESFNNLFNTILAQTTPNPVPQPAMMIFEASAGKQGYSFFRDRPIVPDAVADLPAELQWTEQTSLTARKIGAAFGVSPLKVDHLIQGTTGGLGKQIVHNVIDRAVGAASGEERTAVNVAPGMRFFSTPAGISSDHVEKFYQQLATAREQKAGKKIRGVPEIDSSKRIRLEETARSIASVRKKIRATTDATEKQRLYLHIADLAENALQ